jgi:hypothetical protein
MVKKIIGYNEEGEKVFERDARDYDKSIANTTFGVSLGDIVKAVPIIFLCGIVWANQQSFNSMVVKSLEKNAEAIGDVKTVLANLNNYLSSTTGKRFRNGEPL